MRLYSHFDTFELYNIRRGVGKLFFCFFASLFSFRRQSTAERKKTCKKTEKELAK